MTTTSKAAKDFLARWQGRGNEKQDTQKFWIELLSDLLGAPDATQLIDFERPIPDVGYADAYLPRTHVLVEQKSLGVSLLRPARQSDGALLTPYGQAKRYADALPLSQKPRWVVCSNFAEIEVRDMENPHAAPERLTLAEAARKPHRLRFLVDTAAVRVSAEEEASVEAGRVVGRLYDKLRAQYLAPDSPSTLHNLNRLCVRLVFLLYAEDAPVLPRRQMFGDYLRRHAADARGALLRLFDVLATPAAERDPYIDDDLAEFPHVGGALFEGAVVIPRLTAEIVAALTLDASERFDWGCISPTIFGALFESTLNPAARRSGGMHYTSVANIHRLIGPLFLDGLRAELQTAQATPDPAARRQALRALQARMSRLTFLDPACGSGNFLTETYLCLRRLENEALALLMEGGEMPQVFVSPAQMRGIEVNDFAATVAQTALWIAESQMAAETEAVTGARPDFLPLRPYAGVREGNALRADWREVCGGRTPDYIIGNPPFVGARMMAQGGEQKRDVMEVFGDIKDVQDLDYVCCWFKKAALLIKGTRSECALVATNSICQGAQVPILWGVMLRDLGMKINFAWRTFRWTSESADKAAVHVVIVGFAGFDWPQKAIYSADGARREARSIGPYLVEGGDTLVAARKTPLCDVPKMCFGNQPRDGGHFVIDEEERARLTRDDPAAALFLRPYVGSDEFINGRRRWCLWLKGADAAQMRKSAAVRRKVEAVRQFRLASRAKTTNGYAKAPTLFAQTTQPEGVDFLLVPRVSSERRPYVPIGFMPAEVIASDSVQIVPSATPYHFGVLTSGAHMAWMRAVCGRLEMRYRYSKELAYNTFPWPDATQEAMARVEKSARVILDARAAHPGATMADLYDDAFMPPGLRSAHRANDRAVLAAYGWPAGLREEEIVARLMERYRQLTMGN